MLLSTIDVDSQAIGLRCALLLLLCVPFWSGCAALHPLSGIPARYVPDDLMASSRSGKRTIDLSLRGQTPPEAYRVARGDVW